MIVWMSATGEAYQSDFEFERTFASLHNTAIQYQLNGTTGRHWFGPNTLHSYDRRVHVWTLDAIQQGTESVDLTA